MTDQHYLDENYDMNDSGNPEFFELLNKQMNRRDLIKKTAGGAVAMTLAASLTGCGSDDNDNNNSAPPATETPNPDVDLTTRPSSLSFTPVEKHTRSEFTVPDGYDFKILHAVGDPLNSRLPVWDENRIPSGISYDRRVGDNHDGMTFFGMNPSTLKYDANESNQGLLVMNHEYIQRSDLHPRGSSFSASSITEDEAFREVNAHGVSIVAINKNPVTQAISVDLDSPFNRRITAATVIDFAGPVRGHDLVKTAFSTDGTSTRGTINNCGNGYTPWGTYLTTEENFNQYIARQGDVRDAETEYAIGTRYRMGSNASGYNWQSITDPQLTEDKTLFSRWNSIVSGTSATRDFRNTVNTFGWIVEIDPFDNRQRPVKRTALGRFAHEDCRVSRAIPGQPLAFYMGDDSTGEYIYKFVSDAVWDPKDVNGGYAAGDKYMNSGKFYVAKFDFNEATGEATGEWLELSMSNPSITAYDRYKFKDQADILVHARIAADAAGATKMDRPEWVAVNPENGEVYVTLTNNSSRGSSYPTDAANPRRYADDDDVSGRLRGNINGHIIRFREPDADVTATTFTWDIYLFGAESDSIEGVNLSGLTDANDFSSPDGMWFDPRGVLWIQTDDGAYTDTTNCMMLASLPGAVGDGSVQNAKSGDGTQKTPTGAILDDSKLRRFLVGPKDCEITGVTMTPDYKAIFVNVQHPGGTWPANQPGHLISTGRGSRPRSATVVITRKDGGVIAGETLEPSKA
ncbi:PhoX family phosphatase [Acinetobacter towneri]|uniref:PhoX family protein n=1 Tax=Acinetobacter towneri TaxID=202956 RepID=UPI00188B855F|nr:PhoX family phosphatase [Acinetobacter towneri]MBF4520170.1 PhoX family phosphatase [Acinetobacter towneri]